MGKYTGVYQDSLVNLQASTNKTSGEYTVSFVEYGGGGNPLFTGSTGNPYVVCYYFEMAPISLTDILNRFACKINCQSSGTPTIDWAVDLSSDSYGVSWVAWDSGSLPALTASTNRYDYIISTVPAPLAGIVPPLPAFPQFTYLRLSIRVNGQAGQTGSGNITSFRCFNEQEQEFCPKDLLANVLAGSGSPFSTYIASATSLIGDLTVGDTTTSSSGNSTSVAGVNSGITFYIDTKKGSPLEEIDITVSFLRTGVIGISGSMDGAVWSTAYLPAFTTVPSTYQLYTITNILANVGQYRYYRIYALDTDATAVSKLVSVSDLRLFLKESGNRHDIFYTRIGPRFKPFR